MKKELSIILPIFNERDSLPIMVRLLNSSIKFKKEIIIIYDTENDNAINVARSLEKEFENVKLVQNKIAKGVRHAVEEGVKNAKYEIILITAVDEIFPIVAIENMIDYLIQKDLDFISGTVTERRYKVRRFTN